MSELGRLERMDLRKVWETEAQDFTPWLATEENLSVLAGTLHLELELESQETNVGPFRADILCRNTDGGSWVLIENQLERTNHRHLGQLLTYAAGLHAVTICWIAESFTEEHRATRPVNAVVQQPLKAQKKKKQKEAEKLPLEPEVGKAVYCPLAAILATWSGPARTAEVRVQAGHRDRGS